ncbi:hypothetical protein D9611_014802 [Ephemerocybe angulata]|uniref:ABC transmembrane type-1 domain-containing protein n=1 Tax=Ephemerocybe angulata TaxID=980116 RepID=A0A8H5FIF3_9AGAR|nr:hypothetical protein D9611_014802 [Tulosesus angulatus]
MSRPSSTDEKSTVTPDPPVDKKNKSKKRLGIFNRKKVDEAANEKDLSDTSSLPEKAAEPEVPPISFTQLFRFSTKFELFIDALGLLCAAAAGAAQVRGNVSGPLISTNCYPEALMSLLFGNLTNDFVNFGIVIQRAESGNATAAALVPAATESFKHTAALDASYLVYIGVGMFVATYSYMFIWVYTGEVNAKRVREKYLQAVLRQDIAFSTTLEPERLRLVSKPTPISYSRVFLRKSPSL